jgi:hypothetical protein
VNYRRTLNQRHVILPILLGCVVFSLIAYFVYYEMTSCGLFCVRLEGPATRGEPHCDERIPATVTEDGIEEGFVRRVLEIGSRVQRNNRVIFTSMSLPEGCVRGFILGFPFDFLKKDGRQAVVELLF